MPLETIEYGMKQDFTISYEVISANLDVWAQWQAAVNSGLVRFIVDLIKPDASKVNLYDTSYQNGASGSAYILSDEDVKSYLDQYGNYSLHLFCNVKSGTDFEHSKGWYDNISLYVLIKKTKVLVEDILSDEKQDKSVEVTKAEDVIIDESMSNKRVRKLSEDCECLESSIKKVKKTVSESTEHGEWLLSVPARVFTEDSYFSESLYKKLFPVKVEILELLESLTAKKTSGNIVITYLITDPIVWDEVAKKATKWIKNKTEIVN